MDSALTTNFAPRFASRPETRSQESGAYGVSAPASPGSTLTVVGSASAAQHDT